MQLTLTRLNPETYTVDVELPVYFSYDTSDDGYNSATYLKITEKEYISLSVTYYHRHKKVIYSLEVEPMYHEHYAACTDRYEKITKEVFTAKLNEMVTATDHIKSN